MTIKKITATPALVIATVGIASGTVNAVPISPDAPSGSTVLAIPWSSLLADYSMVLRSSRYGT